MKYSIKKIQTVFVAFLAVGLTAYGEPGAAIAIVYDTSGSMNDAVRASSDKRQKYVIASETLNGITAKIDAYSKADNKVQAGIVCFPGSARNGEAVAFGDWNAGNFHKWLDGFKSPIGVTPLGDAVLAAAKMVIDSPLSRKHVVVLTDGENNQGISVEDAVLKGQAYAKNKGVSVTYYFVAFDTGAAQFNGVKKLGVVVLSAGNETELQKGLTNLFTQKILLEEDEKK